MSITIEVNNVGLFGKRDKRNPCRALAPSGDTLAVGATKSEATRLAMDVLLDTYACSQEEPVVMFAKDGSVFVARRTAGNCVAYSRTEPSGKQCGGSYGSMPNEHSTVRSYMLYIVGMYDAVI